MSSDSKEAIMKCRNISESVALQRDAEFEERRHLCVGLFFPSVPEEKLEEHLCRFTRMDDSEDVQKLRNITACLKKGHDTFGKDDRQVLELRASRIECMQKYFQDAPRGIRDRRYANLVKRVQALADSVMDTNHQISFCMRQYEAPEEMLRCESKGGSPFAFEGILQPEYLRCLSVRRERPHSAEMFDSSTVYDNPDPKQKMNLCVMHKRSSSEAFMEYRQYRTSAEKENRRLEDCYNRHLDKPVRPTSISGSAESDVEAEASTAADSEVPTDEPPTTVAPQENEVWSTAGPMTAATGEPDTVRSD